MRDAFIQSGLCFIATLVSSYLLAYNNYNPLVNFSLVGSIACLGLIIFYSKKFMLSGVLAGSLSGTVNLVNLFSIDLFSWWFLLYASILSILTAVIYLTVFLLSDRFNLRDVYGNGGIIPLVAFLAGAVFLILSRYAFGFSNINFLESEGMFAGTDAWHFLILPIAVGSVVLTSRINRRLDSIYNQFGLLILLALTMAGGLLIAPIPFYGVEFALAWVGGLFIGTTRLAEYNQLKHFLSAAVLFGLFYILLRNLFADLPMMIGTLTFSAVWIVQKIMPASQTQINSGGQSLPTTNLSNIESYYQSQSR